MSGFRLAEGGDAIERERPVAFSFNGRAYSGYEGDTLASALIASGVDIVGRSFKYHRPRGLLAAGNEEPNGIVQLGDGARSTPNLKATTIPLYEGLAASSVNAWPSVDVDFGAVNNALKRFLPAGFYYKTFFWPGWEAFEPFIRRAAGLGRAPHEPDADVYDHQHAHCDVLVVGGGPAGLAAAVTAADAGVDVVLTDDRATLGGALLWDTDENPEARAQAAALATRAVAHDRIRVLKRATVLGHYDHNFLAACERIKPSASPGAGAAPAERLWRLRAREVVLATGAIERPMAFANNDRPGVMLASAVLEYARRYGVACGRRAVVFANNDHAYRTAFALMDAGLEVATIVDPREGDIGGVAAAASARGVDVRQGSVISNVIGRARVRGVEVGRFDATATDEKALQRIDCDLALVSAGWSPRVHLFAQSGGRVAFDDSRQAFVPDAPAQAVRSAGGCNGAYDLLSCLSEGTAAAEAACARLRDSGALAHRDVAGRAPSAEAQSPIFRAPLPHASAKAWVDFQNDVTTSDIDLAARENYRSVEHLKRYTTLGMATDQGKTSNVNGFAVMAASCGVSIGEVGTTKFRPPYEPVTLGALAGRRRDAAYHPIRHLPTHDDQAALGATFEDWGGWARPTCYPNEGESRAAAINREILATRGRVGLFEASPLGKIDVRGKDAAVFLDRVFVNTASTLKIGRARYGVMANEHGVVVDDGVFFRLAEDHFLCSTTSGGADRMAASMEEWLQCEWTDLDVFVTNVTTCWATFALAGPLSRDVLGKLARDVDLSRQAFHHMSFTEGRVADASARIARVSFTGELAFEISVPARSAGAVWRALMEAGGEFDIAPYGIEANLVMRAEKGFIHVGADTDGLTLPQDIGFERPIKTKKSDFIGRRSMMRLDARRNDRLHFVGLKAADNATVLPVGAHIVDADGNGRRSGGYVSSSYWSPTLQCGIALARVRAGRARTGETVAVFDDGRTFAAEIVSPCFLDPDGERLDR